MDTPAIPRLCSTRTSAAVPALSCRVRSSDLSYICWWMLYAYNFVKGFFLIFLDSLASFLIHSFIDNTAVCVCMTSTKNKGSLIMRKRRNTFLNVSSSLPSLVDSIHLSPVAAADAVHPECGRRLSRQLLLLVLHHNHIRQRILLLQIA